ncbi:barstar family protein [Rhodococcus spelaei]|uniref:Barstar family protein n=1 Tax=Rhodococcus spelaei TaxID=2546320 RepID=A0A541B227_9NOCA|nr:barstar family protein [Rhodococcus spelaei]TQF66369.1 barstar family protein [Rhodococcus spelaei]
MDETPTITDDESPVRPPRHRTSDDSETPTGDPIPRLDDVESDVSADQWIVDAVRDINDAVNALSLPAPQTDDERAPAEETSDAATSTGEAADAAASIDGVDPHEIADDDAPPFWDRLDDVARGRGIADPRFPWLRIHQGRPALHSAIATVLADPTQPPTHVVTIQGARCRSLSEFCSTWGDALEFPRYYGRNIDAFSECFRDLLDLSDGGIGSQFGDRPGRPVERLVICVADAELMLEHEDLTGPEELIELLDQLWSDVAQPRCDLHVVYSPGNDFSREALRQRIGMTGSAAERAASLARRIDVLASLAAALDRRDDLFDAVSGAETNAETLTAVQELLGLSPAGAAAVTSMPVTSFNASHQRGYRRRLDTLRAEHRKLTSAGGQVE